MSENTQLVKPQTQSKGLVDILKSPNVKSGFSNVATKFLTPERMVSIGVNAVTKTPDLLKCDQKSVLGAMMTCASLGLEPNTVLGHAYLIPYNNKRKVNGQWVSQMECQFQIGYRGFIELARRIPGLIHLQAECIHEGDKFENFVGTETKLLFQKALRDRGEPIGAFAYAKFIRPDGAEAEMSVVLPFEELEKIRECSGTYTSLRDKAETETWAQKKLADTPWVKWFDEMAAKSAIKRLCKQLPLGQALAIASEIDSLSDEGSFDMGAMSQVDEANAAITNGTVPMLEHSQEEEIQVTTPLPEEKEEVKVRKATAKAVRQAEEMGKNGEVLPEDMQANPRLVAIWEEAADIARAESEGSSGGEESQQQEEPPHEAPGEVESGENADFDAFGG